MTRLLVGLTLIVAAVVVAAVGVFACPCGDEDCVIPPHHS